MLRVGIVAEGKSEWFVLEEMMRAIHSDIEFQRLRPDLTLVSGSPHGWRGVRAWCRELGGQLETFMTGVEGKRLDLLVIHVDCSMAHNEEADRPCPPALDTADALRKIVIQQWLGHPKQPPFVVVTHPSKTTDAWVVAALEPPYKKLANIECEPAAENELVARGLLRKKDGEVKKPEARYLPLAQQMAQQLATVCTHCTQAARFVAEFQAAIPVVADPSAPVGG
jgi:hypothetical protein